MHEASRVYGDKMVDFKDQELYTKLVAETTKKLINVNLLFSCRIKEKLML